MIAFNFANRSSTYKRHAEVLIRVLSAFSSIMREYLGPVEEADQCAQNVDNTRIAVSNVLKTGLN